MKSVKSPEEQIINLTESMNKLQESADSLRLLVENINEVIYVVDTSTDPFKGKVEFIGAQVKNIIGYDPEEFLENPLLWFQIVHPDDVPDIIEDTHKITQLKKPITRTYRLKVKDSEEYRWFEDKVVPRLNSDGNIEGFFGVARDITRNKMTEQALRESEERFRTIVETAPNLILISDKKGKNVYVSPNCKEITGYSQKELLGKLKWWVHKDDEKKARNLFDSTLKSGTGYKNFEYKAVKKNGEIWYASSSWNVIHDDKGELTGVVLESIDITERKKAEKALSESEARYRSVVESQTEFIVRWKPDGTRTFVNEAYCQYFGKSWEELIGSSFFPLIVEKDRQTVKEKIARLKPNNPVGTDIHRVIRPDGKIGWQEWTDQAFFDENGKIKEIQSVGRDITEKKEIEHRLELSIDILEKVKAIVLVADKSGEIIYANQGVKSILGFTKEQILGDGWWNLTRTDEKIRKKEKQRVARIASGKQSPLKSPYERLVKDSKGRDRWLFWQSSRNVAGYAMGIGHDITEQKISQKALTESENKFRTLYESAGDAIFLMKDNTFIDCNRRTLEIFGCKRKDIIGQTPFKFSPPRQPDGEKSEIKGLKKLKAAMKEKPQIFEWEHKKLDGTPFYAEINLARVELSTGSHVQAIVRDISVKKQAEEALRNSQKMMQLIMDTIPQRIFWKDRNFKYLGCNKPFAKDAGLNSPEEIIGKHDFELSWKASAKLYRADDKEVMEKKIEKINFEEPQQRSNGTNLWLRTSKKPLLDTEGNVIGIFGSYEDITESKMVEEALKASEEKFSKAFRLSPDVIIISSVEDGKIIEVNDRFSELTGYNHKEAIGKTALDLNLWVNPEDRAKYVSIMLADGHIKDFETKFRMKDGQIRTALMSGEILEIKNEKFILGTIRDITERREAEEALEESERRYKMATLAGNVGVWDFNLTTNEIYVDPVLKMILGYDDNEIENRMEAWLDLVHPSDRKKVTAEAEALVKGKIPRYDINYRMLHRDGSIRWFQARGSLYRDVEDRPNQIIGTNTDITRQVKAELEKTNMQSQLIRAQKLEAIGTLAGGIAHDFNNLLTTIQGYTDLSLHSVQEHERLYRNLKQIQKASRKAANLTNQLLLFSRKQAIEPTSLNINEIVLNILQLVDRIIGEDIFIETDLAGDIWKIWADAGNMEQMVMNLILNARDALPKGGKISIKSKNVVLSEEESKQMPEARAGRFVCITFRDNGIGMSPEIMQHIFEPFFTTKEIGKGTGLGLSVVYGIIQQHEGWITVDSELNKGSEFRVYIPASFVKRTEKTEEQTELRDYRGKGELILLVEDEEGIREFAAGILEEYGYRVVKAESFGTAIQKFEENKDKINLIFSDVVLPDKSGLDLVNALLKQKKDISVLLTSGYTGDKSNWNIIKKKGHPFLKKPFALLELLKAVRHSLEE
jgi:two-component system cell cycle sensor histidine kinase/response regulator CckA